MAVNMVRCNGCHEVYDAAFGACTKCHLPYKPPVARPEPYQGLYSDRYAADDLPPLDPSILPPVTQRRRNNTGIFIGGGFAIIGCAVIFGILFGLGVFGASAPTAPPRQILSITEMPSATPTLPESVQRTIDEFSDPLLNAQLVITSHVQVFAGVPGQNPMNVTIKFDGQVSNGNQWGTLSYTSVNEEMRLIDGTVYRRMLPSGKWEKDPNFAPFMIVCPFFGITKTRDIQLVGEESRNNQDVLHLRSTRFWNPSITRMAMWDLSQLYVGPNVETLNLWTALDGTPLNATFSATNTTGDGTKLVDIEVSITFQHVGVPRSIDVPGPNWSPSPTDQV